MRRALTLFALLLVPAAAAFAGDGTAMLGKSGELYRVRSGVYAQLFNNAPNGQGGNQVLALEITRNGATQRLLVPGTNGPEVESSPALTVDRVTNRVYLVWEGRQNYHSVLTLLSRGEDDWSEAFEFAADPFSFKSNPQLATTLDRYQTIGADGEVSSATRVILHLVWFDDGGQGERVLYSPLVVEDGDVLRANRIFDLQEMSSGNAASGIAIAAARGALLQKPQVRGGRDRESVVVSLVEPATGRLATLELRSVTGELVSFGDKARVAIIDTGARNPGLPRGGIVDKARVTIIDTGRRLLRPAIADYLSEEFLARVRNSDPMESLEDAAEKARVAIIDTGVSLRRGPADKALSKVVEIGQSEGSTNASHLLDVRRASRRDVPTLPDQPLRVFLSQSGDDAALAWVEDGAVRYRETMPDGSWGEVNVLTLGSSLSADDAYRLVEQRVTPK
jgi:hypothetical protein